MAARKIPIAGQKPGQQTAWASSLDLVFSFSRSAAFFGDNLPSGPSFVDSHRYRHPGQNDDGDSSFGGPSDRDREASEEREESIATTSDDHWSADETDGQAPDSWDKDPTLQRREQLPPNALLAPTSKRRPGKARSRAEAGPSYGSSPKHGAESGRTPESRTRAADERTPLIPSGPKSPSVNGEQRKLKASIPRQISAENSAGRSAKSPMSSSVRRLSIISSEAWQAAIEENRGQSTWGQTLFNTCNVLTGVGLLAEPLAFAEAGWVCGTLLLLFCALITNYTGKILAKMMMRDPTVLTYADVLIKAYGQRARTIIYSLFVLELGSLAVALVTLFADSMESLFPQVSSVTFKVMFFFIIVPTTFVPLRFLSISSLLGLISTFTLLMVLVLDGALMPVKPGSLRDIMPTSAGPQWMRLPLSFGLLMSGFSGHAVIPSLFRDMKDKHRFNSMLDTAYLLAFAVSFLFGALGYVMFGQGVSSEVTRDLIQRKGNPVVLNKIAVWMVALNPVVKYAVANAPLVQTFETMIGIHPVPPTPSTVQDTASGFDNSAIEAYTSSYTTADDSAAGSSRQLCESPREPFWRRYSFVITRPLLTAVAVVLAIVIPDFARVLAFLGSASAFVICCIGPIGAFLILSERPGDTVSKSAAAKGTAVMQSVNGNQTESWNGLVRDIERQRSKQSALIVHLPERAMCWILLLVSICMAIVGTIWTFLPLDA